MALSREEGDVSRLRVVIAEDHFLMREGVRELLEGTGSAEVVAAVGNARDLLAAVDHSEPDAVLTRHPNAARALHRRHQGRP